MFISNAELFRIQTELRSLALRVDLLRDDLAEKANKRDESKWADAVDADLRAEIALLAEALGYVREVGGPKYRKAHTK